MGNDKQFMEYVISDVFHGIQDITSKSMFGGYGVYQGAYMIGLIAEGELYLRVDPSTSERHLESGGHTFSYHRSPSEKTEIKGYVSVTEDVMERRDELREWVGEAYGIAMKKQESKKSLKKNEK